MKKFIKPFILIIIFCYLGLYFVYSNGYYESKIRKEQELMEQMVLKYEEDLKNGVDVSKNNYSIIKPDYSNNYSKTTLKISKKIEHLIDGSIKFLFKKLNRLVSE